MQHKYSAPRRSPTRCIPVPASMSALIPTIRRSIETYSIREQARV